ncbi:hypothetical protein PFLUV_G00035070 [Perca fluviatilis]|uniref:Uncharacterized protein n=1 Tax=Perca fluviatilis TaxID=8168 RepID=A0A6A5EUU5_PERFL|nr:hypothetical protein PFLUV_G00035070 [Perca fluviatilis]
MFLEPLSYGCANHRLPKWFMGSIITRDALYAEVVLALLLPLPMLLFHWLLAASAWIHSTPLPEANGHTCPVENSHRERKRQVCPLRGGAAETRTASESPSSVEDLRF